MKKEHGIAAGKSIFLEEYIPSQEVRALIRKTGHEFSDRDKAAVIWNSNKLLFERHRDLEFIAAETEDEVLKQQITQRIDFDTRAIRHFINASQGFIYATNTNEYPGEDNIIGYFKSAELALRAGKKSGYTFTIEKHQIIDENTEPVEHYCIVSPVIEPDVNMQIKEYHRDGEPVAEIYYDKRGYIERYWTDELSREEQIKVNTLSRERFENSYVVIPNPFQLDDRVRIIGHEAIGRVSVSQKDWEKTVKKALRPNATNDFSDVSITIQYEGDKRDHEHVSPIFLERVLYEGDAEVEVFEE